MIRSVTALAGLLLALALGGCSWGDKLDEKKDWSAADYYRAAKEEFDQHAWDAAIKLYEQLEAKFPFGRFAQQAQLEIAYCSYNQAETAPAGPALENIVKLHPTPQNAD